MIYSFARARGLSRPHFVIEEGTFNDCGRSKAWETPTCT